MLRRLISAIFGILVLQAAAAIHRDRDFSGVWVLDRQRSDLLTLPAPPGETMTVTEDETTLSWSDSNLKASWTYQLDGRETRYRVGDLRMNSQTKWEGDALLIHTIVAGPQNYVLMDRWRLSRDHNVLTIKRQIHRGIAETEALLVYRNQRPKPADAPKVAKAAPETPVEFIVQKGTKIPVALLSSLSTKHASEGDRVYLETVFPITVEGRIVIPRGSQVTGTVTEVKRPGRVKGKGEVFLRFDSLTLPNGITRDFRSRLGGADSGEFDRAEGKIKSEGNKGGDGGTVAKTTAAGASVGGIAGGAAGNAGRGVGIGAAAGAAAGLAAVMLSRGPDLVLPKGTNFEVLLDRSLRFEPKEVEF